MFKTHNQRNKIFALLVFIISVILYFDTMAPTASFWDAGEFIAVANGLQVTHPPGAPLYLLLGRLFSMFAGPEYIAACVNFLSVVASSFTIMFLYLIIVQLVVEWKGSVEEMDENTQISMYAGGFIGALTFMVTDSFWFNAVEAEVYALSMFFTSIVVWLAMKWAEHSEEEGNERWLVLIAYMCGLALGVHLLNLLTIFFVTLIIYFKKVKVFKWSSFIIAGVIGVASFLTIYPTLLIKLPELAGNLDKGTVGLINPAVFVVLIIGAIVAGLWYTQKNQMKWANTIILCVTVVMIGYTSYAVVFIRSAANPPVDENDPENTDAFVSYLKREQYGNTPLLKGRSFNNAVGTIDQKEKLFPRRWSSQPHHIQKYAQYSSDFDYFWNYQFGHMYARYFGWNFIGREADIQDTGVNAGFSASRYADNAAHNPYFYIPFLIGLLGFLIHFQNDWKRALAVLALFIVTGVAIMVYLNQYPYQPRERDYAYVGSFFAFAIWVGIGGTAILDMVAKFLKSKVAQYAVFGLLLFASPIWMGYVNYHDHDRSERYVAPDYAYNLLNSCAPNAIVFTNGDNDTFPLWYIQEVEGVRTDVRVVCLSLLNTNWYIKQLKNQWSHESAPLPISYTDEEVDRLANKFSNRNGMDFWEPQAIRIPVDKEALKKIYESESGVESPMSFGVPVDSLDDEVTWFYEGRLYGESNGKKYYYTMVQTDIIIDILKTNKWERPVYFANTVAGDSQVNLQRYFKTEGQAYRVVPKRGGANEVTPDQTIKRIKNFRFRELDNPNAYFDENVRGVYSNYRFTYAQLASELIKEGRNEEAIYWLNESVTKMPFDILKDDALNSFTFFLVNYIKAEGYSDASQVIDTVYDQIKQELIYANEDINLAREQGQALQEAFTQAKRNADFDKARQLNKDVDAVNQLFKSSQQSLSLSVTRLALIQNVYFNLDQQDKVEELYTFLKELSPEVYERFPKSLEQNEMFIDNFIK